jgi:hypothetical protein
MVPEIRHVRCAVLASILHLPELAPRPVRLVRRGRIARIPLILLRLIVPRVVLPLVMVIRPIPVKALAIIAAAVPQGSILHNRLMLLTGVMGMTGARLVLGVRFLLQRMRLRAAVPALLAKNRMLRALSAIVARRLGLRLISHIRPTDRNVC